MPTRYVLVLLSLLPGALAWAAPPSPPTRSELSLGGLKIDDSLAVVYQKLGKPPGTPGDHDHVLSYAGLRIEMTEPGHVLMLESTSPRYCTPSGLCPGQPMEEARKRWGEGEIYDEDSGNVDYGNIDDSSCFLEIKPDPSRKLIRSVALACP